MVNRVDPLSGSDKDNKFTSSSTSVSHPSYTISSISKSDSDSYSDSYSDSTYSSPWITSNTSVTSSFMSGLNPDSKDISSSALNTNSVTWSQNYSQDYSQNYSRSYSDDSVSIDISLDTPLTGSVNSTNSSNQDDPANSSTYSESKSNSDIPPYAKSLKMKNMVKYDKEVNDEIEKSDKYTLALGLATVIISGLVVIGFLIAESDTIEFCKEDSEGEYGGLICVGDFQLFLNAGTLILLFLVVGVLLGVIVTKKHINVGYTRKTLHFMSFFLPFGIDKIFPLEANIWLTILKFWIIMTIFVMAIKIIRRKVKPFLFVFRAIDRPDDRPYTLKWMFTQFIASTLVILPFVYLWDRWTEADDVLYEDLALVLTIINGLGDGLAEPVGVTIGKHKYKTRALWYKGKFWNGSFTRSYEGSFMVLSVSICSLAGFNYIFTTGQLFIAMLTLPIIMTLTEAFAPRTWDSPFLFLIGAAVLTGIVKIPVDDIKYLWIYIFILAAGLTGITGFMINKLRKEKPEKWYKNEWLFLTVGSILITLSAYGSAIYDLIRSY